MLQRQPFQARYEFEIPGVSREICFSDIQFQKDNDDDCAAARLDRLQFQAQGSGMCETCEFEDPTSIFEPELIGIEEPGYELEDTNQGNLAVVHHEMLEDAVATLTDKQTIAVQLWVNGASERNAADFMGAKQATYQEMLWGKNGIGGAIPKLRKHFPKHPVTSLLVCGSRAL